MTRRGPRACVVEPTGPVPWRQMARVQGDDVEARIGALLAEVPAPPPWDRAAATRVLARLRAAPPPRRQPDRRSPGVIRLVRLAAGSTLGLLLLFLSGMVIAAGGVGVWWKVAGRARSEDSRNAEPRGHATRRPSPARSRPLARVNPEDRPGAVSSSVPLPVPSLVVPSLVAPSLSPPGAASVAAAPPEPSADLTRSQRASRPSSLAKAASRAAPGAPPGGGALGGETVWLERALTTLRREKDPAAALALLDDYFVRFPRGLLAEEARRARVDALLTLGRADEARTRLDELELPPVGRGLELRLIRGELRAPRSCAAATADFDEVIARAVAPVLLERALYGRALCHERQGLHALAARDASAYLSRFPNGRFAASLRRLGGERTSP